jgi:hypothetical protein
LRWPHSRPRSAPKAQRKVVDDLKRNPHAATNAAREVRRSERLGALADATAPPLRGMGRFAVILADPPWCYEVNVAADRDIEINHYPTMPLDEIMALPVADLAHYDAVLFLWCPAPMTPEGMRVISAWGFKLRTGMVWDKGR